MRIKQTTEPLRPLRELFQDGSSLTKLYEHKLLCS